MKQRAGMHRTGRLVGALLEPDHIDDGVELRLLQPRFGGQADGVYLVHEVAEHTPLAAARGDHAPGGALLDAVNALAGFDRRGVDLPVHRDRLDFVHRRDQALVEQVAQHQPFGVRAQRHERDELALVHVHREVAFGRNGDGLAHTMLVHDLDRSGQRRARLGQLGQGHGRRLPHEKGRHPEVRPLGGWREGVSADTPSPARAYFLAGVVAPAGAWVLGGLTAVAAGEWAPAASAGLGAT